MNAAEAESAPLQLLSLEITGKCNLTCSHCYADSGPRLSLRGEMAKEDWLRVIDEAAALGCREVTFIGGEPTLHPDLPAMLARVALHQFRMIEVFTNATHLGPALLELFVKYRVGVAASFYSAEAAIHDQITGVTGSWKRTVDGLTRAKAAGLAVRVSVVEMAANQGQSDATVAFLRRLGVSYIRVDRMRGVGRGAAGAAPTAAASPTTASQSRGNAERFSELCGDCWRGKLCVTSSGEAFPCVLSRRTSLGNAKEGLEGIVASRQLQEFRGNVREIFEARVAQRKCSPGKTNGPELAAAELCSPGQPDEPGPHEEHDRPRCSPGPPGGHHGPGSGHGPEPDDERCSPGPPGGRAPAGDSRSGDPGDN